MIEPDWGRLKIEGRVACGVVLSLVATVTCLAASPPSSCIYIYACRIYTRRCQVFSDIGYRGDVLSGNSDRGGGGRAVLLSCLPP
jgi:hypothetical protein